MRILSTLALTLLTNSLQQVSARLAYPFVRSFGNDGEAWSPPKQTNLAEAEEASAITGSSPRPTEPPKPIFGRANLHARLDGYTLASDICGFKPSNGKFRNYRDKLNTSVIGANINCKKNRIYWLQ